MKDGNLEISTKKSVSKLSDVIKALENNQNLDGIELSYDFFAALNKVYSGKPFPVEFNGGIAILVAEKVSFERAEKFISQPCLILKHRKDAWKKEQQRKMRNEKRRYARQQKKK